MELDTYCCWCGDVLDVDADWYEFDDLREFCSEDCSEAFWKNQSGEDD